MMGTRLYSRHLGRLVLIASALALAGCGRQNISGTYAGVKNRSLLVLRLVESKQGQITGDWTLDQPNGNPVQDILIYKPKPGAIRAAQIAAGLDKPFTGNTTGTVNGKNIAIVDHLPGRNMTLIGTIEDGKISVSASGATIVLKKTTPAAIENQLAALEKAARHARAKPTASDG